MSESELFMTIYRLAHQGFSDTYIAKYLGLSTVTTIRLRRIYGIKPGNPAFTPRCECGKLATVVVDITVTQGWGVDSHGPKLRPDFLELCPSCFEEFKRVEFRPPSYRPIE